MLLARLALLAALLLPAAAFAQRETTREGLSRVEESLTMRLEDGRLRAKELTPAIVVSVAPAYEESKAWYPTAALSTLVKVFGASSLRSCEACMAPQLYVADGRMEHLSGGLGAVEITRLDEANRGNSAPARTAIWLDENGEGVSLRIVNLKDSRILVAENFDPNLLEQARSRRSIAMARELERRARGDSLTHIFIDVTVYPGQHLSMDWVEQWGETNNNLAGISMSLFDPVLGFGAAYYRIIPSAMNMTVGGKVLLSVPTALVSAISKQNQTLIDPMLTAVFVARLPFGGSNWGLDLTASTNGRVGVGLSLMNFSLLPILP